MVSHSNRTVGEDNGQCWEATRERLQHHEDRRLSSSLTSAPLVGYPLPSLGVFSCLGVWGAQYAARRLMHRRSIIVDSFPFFLLVLVHGCRSEFTNRPSPCYGGIPFPKLHRHGGESRASRRISKQHRNQKGHVRKGLAIQHNPTP